MAQPATEPAAAAPCQQAQPLTPPPAPPRREGELHRGVCRRGDDGILDCLLYMQERGAQVGGRCMHVGGLSCFGVHYSGIRSCPAQGAAAALLWRGFISASGTAACAQGMGAWPLPWSLLQWRAPAAKLLTFQSAGARRKGSPPTCTPRTSC